MVNEEKLEEEAKATVTSYARAWGGTFLNKLPRCIIYLYTLFTPLSTQLR